MPRVAVLILNWNGQEDTLACLESIARMDYPAYEVVVVDNASTDGSVEAIRGRFPQATILVNDENLGYAGGNNRGLEYALAQGFDYVCLLNNDVVVEGQFLRYLVAAAQDDPQAGLVGPTVYYFARPDTIWSAGGKIDWRRGQASLRGLEEVDRGQYGEIEEVDYLAGCAILVKRAMVEKAGPLDPRFFMYFEEVEWCVRAAQAGFKTLHVPAAKVWHKISIEAQAASPRVTYYMVRNHLLFLRASRVGLKTWAYVLARYARMLASYTLRPKHWPERAKRDAMAKGFADFWLGRWGRCWT